MGNLWKDIRYSIRMLSKNPGFTAVAILILGLGIGVNTAMYSMVQTLVLRRTMARNPRELVQCFSKNTAQPNAFSAVSYPNYRDLRRTSNKVFADLTAHNLIQVGLTEGTVTRRVYAEVVASNFFDLFGIQMFRGRSFRDNEETPGSSIPVAIISYDYWKMNGEDPQLVGKNLRINGQPMTIVGITPQGFTGSAAQFSFDIYLPLGLYHVLASNMPENTQGIEERGFPSLLLIGRLRQGISIAEADAQLSVVSARLALAYPDINKDYIYRVLPLPRSGIGPAPMPENNNLWIPLMAMPGLVLLIACVNLANMLLARGAARRREFAIRIAIGGGRGRILRQLLMEGLMLSLLGGLAALVLAGWTSDGAGSALNHTAAASALGAHFVFGGVPNTSTYLATIIFCFAATLLFGFGPAWKQSRPDLVTDLKEQAGESRFGAQPRKIFTFRNFLVVSQIALSLVLLTVAGLYVRRAFKAADLHPGFSLDRSLLVEIDPSMVRYNEKRTRELYQRLLLRFRSTPGIEAAGLALRPPFESYIGSYAAARRPDKLRENKKDVESVLARYNVISNDYFKALGVPLVQGRDFSVGESESADGPKVAIIDDLLARKLFPDKNPLGCQILLNRDAADRQGTTVEVVGIVPTLRENLLANPDSHIYVPFGQSFKSGMHIHLKTTTDEATMLKIVEREIRSIDPQLPILKLETLADHVGSDLAFWEVNLEARLFSIFGSLSMFLAAIGIYGARSYTASRRTREIGIRMALGASTRDAIWMILREGVHLTMAGLGLGFLLSALAARLISSITYGVRAFDPLVFATAMLVLASVSLLAAYIPAKNASRIDPIVALHYE